MDAEMEMEMQLALALSLAQSISVPSAGGASSSNAVRLGSVVTLGSVDRLAPFRGPHRCRRRASIHGEPLLPLHQALPTLLAALVAAACSVAAACLTSRTTDLRQVSATWNPTHEQPNNVGARGAETARAATQALRELVRINPFTTTNNDISSAMSQVARLGPSPPVSSACASALGAHGACRP